MVTIKIEQAVSLMFEVKKEIKNDLYNIYESFFKKLFNKDTEKYS